MKMRRKGFAVTAWMVVAAVCSASLGEDAGLERQRPNIVLLLSDDQGYGDLGRHGNPILITPNMDRLHDESVRMIDFSVSPTCAPTRAALLTGMQEFNSGVTHTMDPRRRMNPATTTLPQVLGEAGYATGMFGKWHLGEEEGYHPYQRGFQTVLTVAGESRWSHYDPELLSNGQPVSYKGYRTDIFFDEAMQWISDNKEQPFFCYIPTYNAHSPHVVPDEYSAPYIDQVDERTAKFYGMLANLDMNIGRLLNHLDRQQLTNDTLIIFINDNGGTAGVDAYNAQMRGCKATIWRGGTRAFCFWRWPGCLSPRDDAALSAHVDLLPTLAELAGTAIPESDQEQLEGISLAQRLVDPESPWPDRMLFQHVSRWGEGLADQHKFVNCGVRWGKWHLIRSTTCDLGCDGECKHFLRAAESGPMAYTNHPLYHYAQTPVGKWALYDLEADPSQDRNLADANPGVVRRMEEAYEDWWNKVRPKMINEQDPSR